MIHFRQEGGILYSGINFSRGSDGGLSIIVCMGKNKWMLRERGWKNPCKPKFIWGKI